VLRFLSITTVLMLMPLCAQTSTTKSGPRIVITLTPEIHSESVSIEYYLLGPFGARGNAVSRKPNVHSYEIDPSYNGVVAGAVKGLIYVPGCEFATFDIPISGESVTEKSFECRALPNVILAGNIAASKMTRGKSLEIVIYYLADWACPLFELNDCRVPQFQLSRVPLNPDGSFEASVTDFSSDRNTLASENSSQLRVYLRDAKTWNSIGIGLIPSGDLRIGMGGLAIKPFYPNPVQFEIVTEGAK
jgi:hypothetical protein